MALPVSYPRRELRQLRRAWLRRNATAVVVGTGLMATVTVTVTVVMVRTSSASAFTWYFLGAFHVLAVVALVGAFWWAHLLHDGPAVWQMRGAVGEDNTRDELRRAARRRLVWGSVHSIQVAGSDIDHLVVTRQGGVLAIDSKFRTSLSADDKAVIISAARRSATRAQGLVQTVWPREHVGRRRSRTRPVTVHPVVVLWGPQQDAVDGHRHVEGVDVVAGHHLVQWLRERTGEPVDREAAVDLVRSLQRHTRASASPAQR